MHHVFVEVNVSEVPLTHYTLTLWALIYWCGSRGGGGGARLLPCRQAKPKGEQS